MFSKIRGTVETLFQLGLGGPQLKNNTGVFEARNSADAAFVIVRGDTPVGVNDLTTKQYVDGATAGTNDLFLVAEPTTPNNTYTNTIVAGVVTQELWVRTADLSNLKTIDYTRTAGKVTTEVRKVYAANGATIVAQATLTYTYTGVTVTGIVWVRNV